MLRFRPLLWPTVATLVALAILLALGTWQLERRDWKHALIERATTRAAEALVPLPGPESWPGLDLADWEYRPVVLRGRFDHAAEAHAFTSLPEPRGPGGGPGYWVMTPLHLEGGGTVLVNRGFVPERAKEPEGRAAGQIEGVTELTGLLRLSEVPGWFTPEPNREMNVWPIRDVAAIATARGLDDAAPFFVDAMETASGGLPQGGETRLAFRDEHLAYAITWYGLAAVLLVVYLAFHRARGRLGPPREVD